MWKIVYTKQAQKDAKKISRSGLKKKTKALLQILEENPFQNPPSYEKLVGDLNGGVLASHQSAAQTCLSNL